MSTVEGINCLRLIGINLSPNMFKGIKLHKFGGQSTSPQGEIAIPSNGST